ncbi:MAG: protoheme IX farnesyltransferase [Magnetococcales bacterium]|nr:protoheme IX farnesyltransferase [Magnetococcales bacterium]
MAARIKDILTLFKLRIGFAIVLTALTGLIVTPGRSPTLAQGVVLMLAVLLSAAAAGGFNHYFDYDLDARMPRTQRRPFVVGSLPHAPWWLPLFGSMMLLPCVAVMFAVNVASGLFVFLGAFFYGGVYTFWLKRRTWLNIVIGGLAGSFSILAGAAAVDPALGPIPLWLAVVLFLWTPPHFWSLAITLREEYAAARVPMLPVVVGNATTARVIFGHTLLLVAASIVPFFFGLGWVYLLGVLLGGGLFLHRSLLLLRNPVPLAARANFLASIQQLVLFLGGACLDPLLRV